MRDGNQRSMTKLNFGIFSLIMSLIMMLYFGINIMLFGLAVLTGEDYSRWLGW